MELVKPSKQLGIYRLRRHRTDKAEIVRLFQHGILELFSTQCRNVSGTVYSESHVKPASTRTPKGLQNHRHGPCREQAFYQTAGYALRCVRAPQVKRLGEALVSQGRTLTRKDLMNGCGVPRCESWLRSLEFQTWASQKYVEKMGSHCAGWAIGDWWKRGMFRLSDCRRFGLTNLVHAPAWSVPMPRSPMIVIPVPIPRPASGRSFGRIVNSYQIFLLFSFFGHHSHDTYMTLNNSCFRVARHHARVDANRGDRSFESIWLYRTRAEFPASVHSLPRTRIR
jgi:hypothetical protein